MTRMIITAMAALTLVATVGCKSADEPIEPAATYETVGKDPARDTATARLHNARGLDFVQADNLDAAAASFKSALAADMMFGPAHNNLGLVYYRQKDFYRAAWEFQYAAKLMANRVEPQSNLGMVYERVGRLDQAAEAYEQALAIDPDNVEVIGNLARTYVESSRKDDRTIELLREVVMRDTRPEWKDWARERLMLMGRTIVPATVPATGPSPVEPDASPTTMPSTVEPAAEAVSVSPLPPMLAPETPATLPASDE